MKNENRILLILYKQNPLRHCAVEGLFVMSFCLSTFLLLPKSSGMKADTTLFLKILQRKICSFICGKIIILYLINIRRLITLNINHFNPTKLYDPFTLFWIYLNVKYTYIMLNIKDICLVCYNRIWLKMSSYSMFLTIKFVSITRLYFFIFYEYIFIFHIIIDKR